MKTVRILLTLLSLNVTSVLHAETVDIFEASRTGDVRLLMACSPTTCAVNAVNEDGYTPFILAAYYGHNDFLAALLKLGADACAVDGKGNNAFMGVVFKGYADTAKWLLQHTRCDVNRQNAAGQSALMMASLFGREKVIRLLLEHGAKPELLDRQGNSAEKLARAQGLSKIATIIKFHFQ